jgi:aryl-alcohol dehydrogenase-like predicted oxidoreductase
MMADQKGGLLVWSSLAGGLLSGKFDAKANPAEGRRTQMDFPIVDKERAWACIEAMRGIAQKHPRRSQRESAGHRSAHIRLAFTVPCRSNKGRARVRR